MRIVGWLVGIVALVTIGWLIRDFLIRGRSRPRSSLIAPAESLAAFRERAGALRQQSRLLRARLSQSKLWERPAIQARIVELDRQITELDSAIVRWQAALGAKEGPDIYRQCVELYGTASGFCRALALDTLPEPR